MCKNNLQFKVSKTEDGYRVDMPGHQLKEALSC